MIIVICETSAPCTFGHCLSHSAAKEGEPIKYINVLDI